MDAEAAAQPDAGWHDQVIAAASAVGNAGMNTTNGS